MRLKICSQNTYAGGYNGVVYLAAFFESSWPTLSLPSYQQGTLAQQLLVELTLSLLHVQTPASNFAAAHILVFLGGQGGSLIQQVLWSCHWTAHLGIGEFPLWWQLLGVWRFRTCSIKSNTGFKKDTLVYSSPDKASLNHSGYHALFHWFQSIHVLLWLRPDCA